MPYLHQIHFSKTEKDPEAFSMCKEILSKVHPSAKRTVKIYKKRSAPRQVFFPFNVYSWFYVGLSRHWIVHGNGLFQIDF